MASRDKIWLIGAGAHAVFYGQVLKALERDFIVIGNSESSAKNFKEKVGIESVITGGLEKFLNENVNVIPHSAIICTPIDQLVKHQLLLLNHGVKKILVEKPAGLKNEIGKVVDALRNKFVDANIVVAYNRRFYASVEHAKKIIQEDGGVSSFHFEFTEWQSNIDKSLAIGISPTVVKEYVLTMSSHLIDMAFHLGGEPQEMYCQVGGQGEIPAHPCASRFVGNGKTTNGALFSYTANWNAPGRWSLEVLTKKRRLLFKPVEQLQVQPLGKLVFQPVEDIDYSFDTNFKPGMYRQVKTFLEDDRNPTFLTIQEHCDHVSTIYDAITSGKIIKPKRVVALIGAGNIGSRHLQAIAKVADDIHVQVVEPFEESAKLAYARWKEIKGHENKEMTILKKIDDLAKDLHTVIVATSADIRRKIITQLLEQHNVRYLILEKIVFQNPEDFEAVAQLLKEHNVEGTWVNFTRRGSPTYHELKKLVDEHRQDLEPVHLEVNGVNWGLLCNALHYVDFQLWVNGISNFSLESKFEEGFEESKRKGFYELYGHIIVTGENGSHMTLTCYQGSPSPTKPLVATLRTGSLVVHFYENLDHMYVSTSKGQWTYEKKAVASTTVSSVTTKVVEDLLFKGTCQLTTYEEAWKIHLPLLKAVAEELGKYGIQGARIT